MLGYIYKEEHYANINRRGWCKIKESKLKYGRYIIPKEKTYSMNVEEFLEMLPNLDWVSRHDEFHKSDDGFVVVIKLIINNQVIETTNIWSVEFMTKGVGIKPTMSLNELKDEMEVESFIDMVREEGIGEL